MKLKVFALALLMACCPLARAQSGQAYESSVQAGTSQLQAGETAVALRTAEAAIRASAQRWEAYALAGGALMNLKRYEEATDYLSKAIERAPQDKQAALRGLRRQCLVAEAGVPPAIAPAPQPSSEATITQAEVVLWKSIEFSANPPIFGPT